MKTTVQSAALDAAAGKRFRAALQAELARRCADNPQYSLRAFALDLDVDHSSLSQLMRGKRRMTEMTIARIGRRLGLSQEAIDHFVARELLLGDESLADGALSEVGRLTQDAARVITEPHHYAILELLRLETFRPDTRWIAQVLDLTPDEVNTALSRLLHLGLLEMTTPQRWTDRCGPVTVGVDSFAQATLARLAERVDQIAAGGGKPPGGIASATAEGAATAGGPQPARHSEFSSTTIAVHTPRLNEIVQRIHALRRELVALIEQDPRRDDVYRLEIRFQPATAQHPRQETPDGQPRNPLADRDPQS